MMNRVIKKQFLVTKQEDKIIKEKAEKCCLSEAALIRNLVNGFYPKEKPDDAFYEKLGELTSMGNNLNQLARKANQTGFVDPKILYEMIEKMNSLYLEIKTKYLVPEKIKDGDI